MNIAPLFSEFAVLFLFVATVGFIFAACFAIVRRLFVEAKQVGLKNCRLSIADILLLLNGIAGICCIAYGFTEPYQLETTHTTLHSHKLKAGTKLRLVHISDLHCDGTVRTDNKLLEQVQLEKPDLIVFTGDAANNSKGVRQFKSILKRLAEIAPVYASDGNHDTRGGAGAVDRYTGTGANILNCAHSTLNIQGNSIWIGGVAIDSENCLMATLRTAPASAYSILLYHFPEGMREATEANIDLFCTGHTHGGQVRLPLYGAIITMTSLGKKYECGLYHEGQTDMYVNRGIGMTALPVRFLCFPELTVIDVEAEK